MMPSPAEILRFIAKEEPLADTLANFPGVQRSDLEALLLAAAEGAPSTALRTREVRPRQAHIERERQAAPGSPPTTLRIYTDGAARGNPGPAGAGAVLFGPDGEVLERLGRYLGSQTNNVAEYQGLLLGLARAKELGAKNVEVFADSQLMIRQLEGTYKVRAANLVPLWDEARALLSQFEKVRLVHVMREHNVDADEMSNRAIDERL